MKNIHAIRLLSGLLLFHAMLGSVQAGAVVELRLADLTGTPISIPPGGFLPGDQFLVELWLKPDRDIVVREMTVDYRGSDASIIPSFGLDIDAVNQTIDGVPNFWFDYSRLGFFGTYPASGISDVPFGLFSTTGNYTDFSNLISGNPAVPAPAATVAIVSSSNVGPLLTYTSGVFNRVGGMPITIPDNRPPEGFLIDLLGSPDGMFDDRNNGSSITFGFGSEDDPVTIWAAATDDPTVDGSLTYAPGAGPIIVAPIIGTEPTTILLFASVFCYVVWNIKRQNCYT